VLPVVSSHFYQHSTEGASAGMSAPRGHVARSVFERTQCIHCCLLNKIPDESAVNVIRLCLSSMTVSESCSGLRLNFLYLTTIIYPQSRMHPRERDLPRSCECCRLSVVVLYGCHCASRQARSLLRSSRTESRLCTVIFTARTHAALVYT